jgi:hypothetical protein
MMDDNRANFLRGNKPHLLYFWHVMQLCHLLPNTLSILPHEFSASSDGIPLTQELSGDHSVTKKNKQQREEEKEREIQFKHHVSESFGRLATAEENKAVGSALLEKREA